MAMTTRAVSWVSSASSARGGVVRNLTLHKSNIVAYHYTGGIVGYNMKGTIENCHVTGDVRILSCQDDVSAHGGIVGENYQGTVKGCTSAADVGVSMGVTIGDYFGGIVGYNDGTITGYSFYGSDVASSSFHTDETKMGAIVGANHTGGSVTDCLFICQYPAYKTAGKNNGTITRSGLAYEVELANNDITIANGATTYNSKFYVLPGKVVTFSYSGTVPEGSDVVYIGNAGLDTEVISGRNGQFIMLGYEIEVTVTFVQLLQYATVNNKAELRAALTNGADIVLGSNIDIAKEVEIDNNIAVTIDLNGKTVNRGLTSSADYGHVLKVISGSKLTINDSSGDNSGTITGAYVHNGGAINNACTLVMNSGTITSNHNVKKGAGI